MSMHFFKEVFIPSKSMADKIPDFSWKESDGLSNKGLGLKQPLFENSITTRNEKLEGKTHPETGVPYERKTVETNTGEIIKGVFPVFESDFNAKLPDELLEASDSKQFKEANEQLKDSVDNNPDVAKLFNEEQLEDISNGKTPEGYTWHHSEEKGTLQLVDTETHASTGHTGGKSIWGGGNENR